MMVLRQKKYKKALVIGAGSGRDMASAVLLTEGLRKHGTRVDLAGFLTPWALHSFEGKLEKPINHLTADSRKFIANRKDTPLEIYFEPEMLKLNQEMNLGIDDFYLFSLQHGTEKLRMQLEKLASQYDLILAVDVGGDILARKGDFPSLLTPIVDLSCLEILAKLKCKADINLAVVAPGVDGEINIDNLAEIFDELERKRLLSSMEDIDAKSEDYQRFVIVNEEINRRTNAKSNTTRIISTILSHPDEKPTGEFIKTLQINERRWEISFAVKLAKDFLNKIFYLDLKRFKSIRENIEMEYKNILEAFVKFRRNVRGSEVDLTHIIKEGDNDTIFLLTPGNFVKGEKRKEILGYGIERIAEGKINQALILEEDKVLLGASQGLNFHRNSGFYIVTRT